MGGAFVQSLSPLVYPRLDRSQLVLVRLQAVARQGVEVVSVRLGALSGQSQAQLDGFKSRALRAEAPAQRHLYTTEWQAIKLGSAVPQGTFKIRSVGNPTQRRHQFLLEIHTQGWLALAISANTPGPDWKNYMTGPPASCAVVGTGTNTVGYIELNGMPPSPPRPPAKNELLKPLT